MGLEVDFKLIVFFFFFFLDWVLKFFLLKVLKFFFLFFIVLLFKNCFTIIIYLNLKSRNKKKEKTSVHYTNVYVIIVRECFVILVFIYMLLLIESFRFYCFKVFLIFLKNWVIFILQKTFSHEYMVALI